MKTAWIRLGCFLTGYNYGILRNSSEASAKAVKKYTAAILIISIIWAFIGYKFTQRYLHGEGIYPFLGALIMIVMIIQIERQIILGIGKNHGATLFRIIIGLVMACIGSIIIDQIIFKDDIEKQQIDEIQENVNRLLPIKTQQLDSMIRSLDTTISQKEMERQVVISEVGQRPTIPIPTIQSSSTKDSTGKIILRSTTVTNQSMANPKASLIPVLQKQIDTLQSHKEAMENSKLTMRADLEKDLRSKTGFLDELTVMFRKILFVNNIALAVWILWFVLLFSVELFVLMSKFGDEKNDYDQIVIHQRQMRLSMLDKLSEEKN